MFNYMCRALVAVRTDEDGQTFVEYALILAVAALTFAALNATGLGAAVQSSVTQASNALGA
jgi:Flp pilus assembly pilin Flp